MSIRVFRTLHRHLTQWRGHAKIRCGGMQADFYVASKAEYKHLCGGLFERRVIEPFLAVLEPADVIYEVGGHIGSWSVFLAKHVSAGAVHVFEPDAHNAARNRANLERNRLAHATVVEAAASDTNGTATLNTEATASAGMHSLVRDIQGSRSVQVRTLRLDDYPAEAQAPPPTAMKIDCEGAEGLVLAGAQGLLAGVRVIMLEAHGDTLRAAGQSKEEILSRLADAGFTPVETWPGADVSRHLLARG